MNPEAAQNRDKSANLNRVLAFVLTTLFVGTEWLLFELVRMPYRPPEDMLTFLGTEKYAVMQFMFAMAIGWLALIIFYAFFIPFGWRDYLGFTLLLTLLIGTAWYFIMHPRWPVTPFELIMH